MFVMWKIERIIILFFALMLAINLTIAGSVAAETIYVDDDGTGDFTTIQAALDSASPGDEIVVKPGTYTENVDVTKNVTIVSESGNPADTIVQAASSSDHVFHVTADGVKISGFSLTGASDGDSGIYLDGVEYCLIENNELSENGHGIMLYLSSSNTLNNNTISNNNESGIYLDYSSSNTLENNTADSNNHCGIYLGVSSSNTLNNNTASNNDCGILLASSSSNTLNNNTASNNSYSEGIRLDSSSSNTLNNNTASNNNCGILLSSSSSNNTLSNNTASNNNCGILLSSSSSNNTLSNNTASNNYYGISLYSSSDNFIYNNYFNNTYNTYFEGTNTGNIWNTTKTAGSNIVGGPYLSGNFWANPDGTVYPEGAKDLDHDGIFDSQYNIEGSGFIDYLPLREPETRTITVNNGTGPAADFESIQAAVNAAYDGDTILVYEGTYTENIDVDKANITIRSESGNPFDTIVQSASSGSVLCVYGDGVKISGFSITGASEGSSGIFLGTVEYCLIENNELSENGHGICLASSSYNILNNNRANSNTYCGIWLASSSNNTLNNNELSENKWGIHLRDSSNNTLNSNTASNNDDGIWLWTSSSNMLSNNTASNNTNGICLDELNRSILSGNLMQDNTYNFRMGGEDLDTNIVYANNSMDGKPIYYLVDVSDIEINSSSNAGTIYLIDCKNITVKDLTIEKTECGIYLYNTTNSKLENNSITGNYEGIWLDSSSSNTLSNNTALNNQYGIWLDSSSNSNTLFLNDLLNNSVQIREEGINFWNSSEPVNYLYNGERKTSYLGNYYSDYIGPDADGNGIGDTAYEYDSYPLLAPSDNYIPLAFDNEAPVINSVELFPTSLYPEDSLLVTVNVTDNIGVFSVKASKILLSWTGGNIWQGSLVAEEGTHPVNVSVADAWGNVAWDNSSSYTAIIDTEAPSGISDLQATTGLTWINWTWSNPADSDFKHTILYFNGNFLANTPDSYYNVTGLLDKTEYELGTLTVDFTGNVNETWINDTATTDKTKSKKPSGDKDRYSSSGSSGVGKGSGFPEPASNIEVKGLSRQFVTSGNSARFDFPEGVTCVCYVAFDAKRTFGRTFTTAEMLKGKSALVEKLPAGIVYKNVNIWVGNKGVASPKNIGNAVIGFRVEKEWLESNGVNENAVLLYRYSDGEWSTLVTSVTGNDENFVYFEAKTPDYSPFAIVASRVEIIE